MNSPDYSQLHPRFAWMNSYLSGVAVAGRLPGRQDIDPVNLRALLPFINLVDVERQSGVLQYRFRLIGTLQTTAAGREISGKYLEDAVLPEFVKRISANMTAAVKRREAIYDRFVMPHPDRDFIDSERVYFPLAKDGETVDMLLILHGYPSSDPKPSPNSRPESKPVSAPERTPLFPPV